MGDVVNLMLLQELRGHDPGTVRNDLIHPLAVTDGLCSLLAAQHGQTLSLVCLFVSSHPHNEIDFREGLLCLFQLSHVSVAIRLLEGIRVLSRRSVSFFFDIRLFFAEPNVPQMKEIKDAIRVDTNRPPSRWRVHLIALGGLYSRFLRRCHHSFRLFMLFAR